MANQLEDFRSRRRIHYDWIRSEFLRFLCAEGQLEKAKQIAKLSEADFIALCKRCQEDPNA